MIFVAMNAAISTRHRGWVMTDLSDVVCAVTLPGLAHLAPVLLMRDGTYRIAPDLPRQHRPLAERFNPGLTLDELALAAD